MMWPSFIDAFKRKRLRRHAPLRLVAFVALWALGFSSTAGLVPHEHALAALANTECVSAHAAVSPESVASSSSQGMRAVAEGHDHDCLGCQLSRSRTALLGVKQAADPALAVGALSVVPAITWARDVAQGRSARGPPRS